MAAEIFISFPSKDVKIASTLCSALESRGFSCWIAARDIQPGENFQIAIVRALRRARIMLLVFTANSNNSEEMAKELALASQQKMMVIPLRIEDVTPNEAFAYEFATRQWIDVFADWETSIDQLCRRIGRALEAQPQEAKPAAPKPPAADAKPPAPAPRPAPPEKPASKAERKPSSTAAAPGGAPVMSMASPVADLDAEVDLDDPFTDDRVPPPVVSGLDGPDGEAPARRRMPMAARIALLAAAFAAVVGLGLMSLAAKPRVQAAETAAPAAAPEAPPAADVSAPAVENAVAAEVKPVAKRRKVEQFDLPVEAEAAPRKEDIPF